MTRRRSVILRGGLGNQFFQWVHALHLREQGFDPELEIGLIRPKPGNQASGEFDLAQVFTSMTMPVARRLRHVGRLEPLYVRAARMMGQLQRECEPGRRSARYAYGYYQHARFLSQAIAGMVQSLLSAEISDGRLLPGALRSGDYDAMHVRSGDYANSGYNFDQMGVLSENYHASITELSGPPLVIVSDDYERARRIAQARPAKREVLLLCDVLGKRDDFKTALATMLHAQTLAIANSSFSAMAAYCRPAGRVIYPRPWFKGSNLAHVEPGLPHWQAQHAEFEESRDDRGHRGRI